MPSMKFLSRLLPLTLLAAPLHAQAPAKLPDADPAMWEVKDADTTIYLFGTFHALDGKSDWFNDAVKRAFDGSNELVLETITPEDPADLQPLILKYGVDLSGKTLTSKLSPDGQKRLAKTLQGFKLPANAFDMFKPFLASMTISTLQFRQMGITPNDGSEKILRTAAAAEGKSVGQVETLDFQMSLFDSLSEAEQIKLLEKTLEDVDTTPREVGKMLAAWNKGDADALAAMVQDSEADSGALYQTLFLNRNKAWTDWVAKRLEKPGVVLMAVGAGHLAGKDSVQSMLKARGIQSSRVPAK